LIALDLSPEALQALVLLEETFVGETERRLEVKSLLDAIFNRMPSGQRHELASKVSPIDLEIYQQVDPARLPERIWTIVRRAVTEHRKLTFNYLSPAYEERRPRFHEVAPYRLVYQWGHWYLRAFSQLCRDEKGFEELETGYPTYRLAYMLDNRQLQVLSSLVPDPPGRLPRYEVHYRLLPPLSRGVVGWHFDEMTITPGLNGSVEVHGITR
jgi:hypothetical protein